MSARVFRCCQVILVSWSSRHRGEGWEGARRFILEEQRGVGRTKQHAIKGSGRWQAETHTHTHTHQFTHKTDLQPDKGAAWWVWRVVSHRLYHNIWTWWTRVHSDYFFKSHLTFYLSSCRLQCVQLISQQFNLRVSRFQESKNRAWSFVGLHNAWPQYWFVKMDPSEFDMLEHDPHDAVLTGASC